MHTKLITHIRQYISLQENDTEAVRFHLKSKSLRNRSILSQQGSVCKQFYFVSKGCLRMFFNTGKGTEQTVQFAIENWWITDYFSFFDGVKSPYSIQAIGATDVLIISITGYSRLLNEAPSLERYFRIMAQRAMAASQFRLKLIFELSKKDMFLHFNSLFPEFVQRVPQYMLASFLGLTPEYLSEIRKKICKT